MTKTYEIIKIDNDDSVIETATAVSKRTYSKQWLIDEIARLQTLLSQFEK